MTPPALLIANFDSLGPVDTIAKARTVRAMLANHPHPHLAEPYPPFVPSLQQLDEAIQFLQRAYDEALNHDTEKIAARNDAHISVKSKLTKLAQFVELAAEGDVNVLKTTGFDFRRKPGKTTSSPPLAAPELAMKHGKVSGTMTARAKKVPGAASYELQFTDADRTGEADWNEAGIHASAVNMEINGLEPGRNYSFRIRAIGTSGRGPWSTPCTLRSL